MTSAVDASIAKNIPAVQTIMLVRNIRLRSPDWIASSSSLAGIAAIATGLATSRRNTMAPNAVDAPSIITQRRIGSAADGRSPWLSIVAMPEAPAGSGSPTEKTNDPRTR